MVNVEFIYRDVDSLGRIVLPAGWRKDMSGKLVLFRVGEEIIIRQRAPDLFRKLKGTLPAGRKAGSIDGLKASGAMDWKLE